MYKVKEFKDIQKKCEREISFMLHNYKKIDSLINERKNELIDSMEVTNSAYLKSIKSSKGNTLENVVHNFDTDYKIQRLKKWKKIINVLCSKLYDMENKYYFYLIHYKYFLNIDEEIIKEKMNLSSKKLKEIDVYIKWIIYQNAILEKLYKGGEEF